jgi:hypothetical protein
MQCVCGYNKEHKKHSNRNYNEAKATNQKRNDQQPHNHQSVQKSQGTKSRHCHITITNIHKQTQDKTLIPIADLCGGAAPAMPNANPASPHKEAANAVLKAGVGLAEADAEFPEDARDELLFGEEAVSTRDGQIPDVREQAHQGRAQAPKGLHGEGREAVGAPLVLSVLSPLLGVPPGGGGPRGGMCVCVCGGARAARACVRACVTF